MAAGQEVVHALTGTVSSIDAAGKTITLYQDNGSSGVFKEGANGRKVSLDKRILVDSTSADDFKKQGDYVIVLYFGDGDNRTAVALRSLGAGPFTAVTGTVAKFQGKEREITITDPKGATQTFRIDASTVAESGMGVEDGLKFSVQKGDQVRIVGTTKDGSLTALFVRQL
jgi:hypothetical protein